MHTDAGLVLSAQTGGIYIRCDLCTRQYYTTADRTTLAAIPQCLAHTVSWKVPGKWKIIWVLVLTLSGCTGDVGRVLSGSHGFNSRWWKEQTVRKTFYAALLDYLILIAIGRVQWLGSFIGQQVWRMNLVQPSRHENILIYHQSSGQWGGQNVQVLSRCYISRLWTGSFIWEILEKLILLVTWISGLIRSHHWIF